MSWWRAMYRNAHDEYEVTFASKYRERAKAVERVCQMIIDNKVKSRDDVEAVVRCRDCKHCEASDFSGELLHGCTHPLRAAGYHAGELLPLRRKEGALMDNKKAAQLLISLYSSCYLRYGQNSEYEEAIAMGIMALGNGSLRLAATPGIVTGDWVPGDITVQDTTK